MPLQSRSSCCSYTPLLVLGLGLGLGLVQVQVLVLVLVLVQVLVLVLRLVLVKCTALHRKGMIPFLRAGPDSIY